MGRISSKGVLFALMLFTAVGTSVSNADVVYNNFGSGDSYDLNMGWTISGPNSFAGPNIPIGENNRGFAFTPLSDYSLDYIELAAGWAGGTNSLNVKLMGDSSGVPGAVLETWTFSNVANFNAGSEILKGDSSVHPLLESGMKYWLVAFWGGEDSWLAWNLTDPEVIGLNAYSNNGGSSWIVYNQTESAFRISGTPVPEPSTMLLLGSGLVGLIGYGRRRIKK